MKTIQLLSRKGTTSRFILTASIVSALTFTACEYKCAADEPVLQVNTPAQTVDPVAKTKTLETALLGTSIDTFESVPSVENQSSVKLAFAKLDVEIAKLNDRAIKTDGSDRAEAASKANNLQKYRDAEMVRFVSLQPATALEVNPPADSRSAAQKAAETAEVVGDKVEDGAKKVGKAIKKAARKTGEAIENAAD